VSVEVGDVLASRREAPFGTLQVDTPFTRPETLRVMPGPQASLFSLEALASEQWTVSQMLDRVGVRLEGPSLGSAEEIVSEPSVFGAVQVARDGRPIIVGPDGPTIGGYPKIAVVRSSDLHCIGQLAPGDRVRFEL
jgi:allophanate hydrolase subunit 2